MDGSAGFSLPPATDSKRGLIRIATQAEVTAGTATDIAVNPAQLEAVTSDSALMNSILTRDGNGSGLDADLLRGLPADFTSSKAVNGYQKLPSGLIIQWGAGTAAQRETMSSGYPNTLPIAFPNQGFFAIASYCGGLNTTTVWFESAYSGAHTGIRYIVIGY